MLQFQTSSHLEPRFCLHCGLPVTTSIFEANPKEGSHFCCAGCAAVYELIHHLGLTKFYELKAQAISGPTQPAPPIFSSYQHYDDPEFQALYIKPGPNESLQINLFLDGIHCAACVWLIEKLPQLLDGVLESRVDFARSVVTVRYTEQCNLSQIAALLHSLGYKPHPVGLNNEQSLRRRSEREFLLRLGISGACAGNTMMLAISLYQGFFTGIEHEYALLHQWACLILTLPVVFYCALPFYRAALGGLRHGVLHIDLPISLGIITGFVASVFNTVRGAGHVYYESICMLVFLLLVGRWFQRQGVEKALDQTELLFSLSPISALRRKVGGTQGETEEIFSARLVPGDIIEVLADSVIPADGIVLEGRSKTNCALLTGESTPESVAPGVPVYCGTHNLASPITITVTKLHQESRLGTLMEKLALAGRDKAPIIELTDRLSGYFVSAVLISALACAIYWFSTAGLFPAIDHTLALLIVTCPCALGLAAPVTLSIAIKKASRSGLLIRGSDVIEKLARITQVFFDKTGTLTEGRLMVKRCELSRSHEDAELLRVLNIVLALEQKSQHPIGGSLREFALKNNAHPIELLDVTVVTGKGVTGILPDGRKVLLGSVGFLKENNIPFSHQDDSIIETFIDEHISPVILVEDGKLAAVFGVGDRVRDGVTQVIEDIRHMGITPHMLSGDLPQIAEHLASEVGIPKNEVYAGASPEQKLEVIKDSSIRTPTAMIGDGANDAAALKAATVGVGVQGGAEICLQVADVFIANREAQTISELFYGARRTMEVIKLNLAFSVFYNLLGGTLAVVGVVNPLIAAILMPLSSLSVVLTSVSCRTFKAKLWT